MAAAPLLAPALGFLLGIVFDAHILTDYPVPVVVLMACSGGVLFRRVRRDFAPAVLLACGIAAGITVHHATARREPSSTIERFATDGGLIARVRGVVSSEVRIKTADPGPLSIRAFRSERTVFLLDVESIAGREGNIEIGGTVRVTVREAMLDLVEHERVELIGRLYRLAPQSNPGGFDWESHMRRHGVAATMVCPYRENVLRMEPKAASRVDDFVGHARSVVRGWLVDDLIVGGDGEAGLLAAMVLGHRSALDKQINDAFLRAGCAHFLAVSGVHVVIVIAVASISCRLLFLSRRQRLFALMATVIAYAMLAEPRPSILRATVMAEIYFVACVLYRERARLNWICATVLILGAVAAELVFDVGYQLSTTAVVGICFLPRALGAAARFLSRSIGLAFRRTSQSDDVRQRLVAGGRSSWQRYLRSSAHWLGRYVGAGLSVSWAAWLATWPVVAVHFGQVHPYGPLATLIMMPMLTILMALGFAKLIVSAVVPAVGPPLAALLDALDSFVVRTADALGAIPGATFVSSSPPWWLITAYYVFLIAWAWSVRRKPDFVAVSVLESEDAPEEASEDTSTIVPRRSQWFLGVAGVTLAGCLIVWCLPRSASGRLVMTVLDVGAGSAIVLELPEGETVLYDAGTLGPVDVGRHIVVPFLRQSGIGRLDRVYISHANIDHFNGIPSVVTTMSCGDFLINERFDDDRGSGLGVDRFHTLVKDAGGVFRTMDAANRRWVFGGATFEMLWPPADRSVELSNNDASTVLRISYAGRSILLTGDIEHAPQQALLARGDLGADVLVLPHHGSVRPSTRAFLEAVGSDVLVRSSNERTADTYNGLMAITSPATVFNTADVGAVRVVIDTDGLSVRGFRESHPRLRPEG